MIKLHYQQLLKIDRKEVVKVDETKATEILRLLSREGYSLMDLCNLIEKIEEIAKDGLIPEIKRTERTLEEKIEYCLDELEIPKHMNVWNYLIFLTALKVKDKNNELNASALYKETAKHFNTSMTSVERAIAKVATKVFEGDISEMTKRKYFSTIKQHITSKRFFMGIVRVVEKME